MVSIFSTYSILGYLKVFKSLILREVNGLFLSLKIEFGLMNNGFVRAFGLGPLSGVLAIFVADTGTLSKLYSEAADNSSNKQIEGVISSGSNKLSTIRFGLIPQVLPIFISQSLYFFESNSRSAVILGIVGAGGIGLQLSERMKAQYWDQAFFIILLILIMVAIIDRLSRKLREKLINE